MKQVVAIALCGVLLIQTALATDPVKLRGWTAWFETRDPVVDATKNHEGRTVYIFDAMGVGHYYPGLDYDVAEKLAKKYAVKHLPATSDVIESDLHRRYMEAATGYAEKYNQTTVKLLGASK